MVENKMEGLAPQATRSAAQAPATRQVVQAEPKQFTMVKNVEGGLIVRVESYDFSVPARAVKFAFNQEKAYLRDIYALGVFVTPEALKQMELGYFTFENLDTLIKMAEDRGFYVPDQIKKPVVSKKDIVRTLEEGNLEIIEKYLRSSQKIRDDISIIARNMYGRLQGKTIAFLEEKLRVSLKPVDLND